MKEQYAPTKIKKNPDPALRGSVLSVRCLEYVR